MTTNQTAPQHGPGREELQRLLAIRNQYPERADEIDAEIRGLFERRVAILVLDMCGFSRRTLEHGIIAYLALIAQMEIVARPAVEGNGGEVIKQEADNLFAVFESPRDAVEAALDIYRGFEAANSGTPEERHLHGCIGIGYGDTLVLSGEDLFGAEMNLASKLGEDLAAQSEILITPTAQAELTDERYICSPMYYEVGDMKLEAFRLDRIVPRAGTGRLYPPAAP
jgi:adenylate cyclase